MLCVLWSGLCLQDPLSLRNAGVVRPGIGTSVSHGAFRAVLNAVGFSKVCGCLRKHGERELRLQVGPPLLSTDQAVRVTGPGGGRTCVYGLEQAGKRTVLEPPGEAAPLAA